MITTGGGGMIITDDEALARRAGHPTTIAMPHPYEFVHDEVGLQLPRPNLNASPGLRADGAAAGDAGDQGRGPSATGIFAGTDVRFVEPLPGDTTISARQRHRRPEAQDPTTFRYDQCPQAIGVALNILREGAHLIWRSLALDG